MQQKVGGKLINYVMLVQKFQRHSEPPLSLSKRDENYVMATLTFFNN